MAINKNRLNDNIKQLETLLAFLKLAVDDNMTMVDIGKELNLTALEMNYELNNCFSRYFKKSAKITSEEFEYLVNTKDLPSNRLLKSIFGFKVSDNVVFPYVDEDCFWAVIKQNYPENYYNVLAMYSGYGETKPLSFEKIANKLGCTRAWVHDLYHRAVTNFDSSILYKIYNFEYTNKKTELENTDEFNQAKVEYEKLLNYMSKVNDIKSLNKYIEENYPEIATLNFNEVNSMFSTPITKLGLSNKLIKVLNRHNINTLADIYMTSAIKYSNMSNFGKIKCTELLEVLLHRNDNHPNRDVLIENLKELIK